LKFAKRLKEAGFTEQQAEALAAAEAELIEANLATKLDLKELEVALKRDIKELETSLKHDMKELEYRMTLKLGAMMVVAVGAVATLVKLL